VIYDQVVDLWCNYKLIAVKCAFITLTIVYSWLCKTATCIGRLNFSCWVQYLIIPVNILVLYSLSLQVVSAYLNLCHI